MRNFLTPLLLIAAMVLSGWTASAHSPSFSDNLAGGGGYLGLALSDIDADRASVLKLSDDRGVEVVSVEFGSPAERYGIEAGDVLLAYNGEPIASVQQLGRLVRETPPGRKVRLQYWRDGRIDVRSVVVGSVKQHDSAISTNSTALSSGADYSIPGADIPSPLLLWKSSLLGIECEPVDSQLAQYFGVERGVLVRYVLDDSPAKKAGFKAGDVLIAVDGRTVATPRDVTAALRLTEHGKKTIPVQVARSRKEITLHVVPPKYPY